MENTSRGVRRDVAAGWVSSVGITSPLHNGVGSRRAHGDPVSFPRSLLPSSPPSYPLASAPSSTVCTDPSSGKRNGAVVPLPSESRTPIGPKPERTPSRCQRFISVALKRSRFADPTGRRSDRATWFPSSEGRYRIPRGDGVSPKLHRTRYALCPAATREGKESKPFYFSPFFCFLFFFLFSFFFLRLLFVGALAPGRSDKRDGCGYMGRRLPLTPRLLWEAHKQRSVVPDPCP